MGARRTAIMAGVGALLAGAALAAQSLEAVGGGAALVVHGDRAHLELEDGSRLQLELPADALVSSLHALGRGWVVAGTQRDRGTPPRLFFLRRDLAGARFLPAPDPVHQDSRQLYPLALVDAGRLVGAAWLEGENESALGVRAAAWNGRRFAAPVWVSPPGRGSQLALAGAVLADGSWLLAWTAFDGADDEVMWSRRVGTVWQAPARVAADDDWPDITPALTAAPGGALLAWSSYDGASYRAVVARFAGRAWEPPRTVGEAGTLYPAFRGASTPPHLLFLDARHDAWEVLALDASGAPARRATAPALAGDATPLIESDGEEVLLRWPHVAPPVRAPWREVR